MRQQPTLYNRRKVGAANQPDWQTIRWRADVLGGNVLRVTFETPIDRYVLKGTPAFKLDGEPVAWNTVNCDGGALFMTSPIDLPSGSEIAIGAQDPALRSFNGGYLAAQIQPLPGPPLAGWSVDRIDANTLLLLMGGEAFGVAAAWSQGGGWARPEPRTEPNGIGVSSIELATTNQIRLIFAPDISAETHLTIEGGGVVYGQSGHWAAPGSNPIIG